MIPGDDEKHMMNELTSKEVVVISEKGRYWYVRNVGSRHGYHTNKNNLKEIESKKDKIC